MWYIIRHGQTFENSLGIQQGSLDTLLSLKGINQAQSIGHRLQSENKDFSNFKFLTSPLARTRHTTQIILETLDLSKQIKPIIEPLIKNRDKGIFQAIKREEHEILFPEEYKKRKADPWNYLPPKGTETKMQAFQRIQNFLEKYKDEENLVIVSHRGINFLITELLQGKGINDIKSQVHENYGNQNYFYSWEKKTKEIKII